VLAAVEQRQHDRYERGGEQRGPGEVEAADALRAGSGHQPAAATRAATPTGTFTQKIVRQPRPATFASISKPPSSWPPTAATPITMP
jgi:hypothetical protein